MQFGPVMEVQHLHQELAASRARVQSLVEQLDDGVKKAEKQLTYNNIKKDSKPLQFLTGLPSGVWTALWDFFEPTRENVLAEPDLRRRKLRDGGYSWRWP